MLKLLVIGVCTLVVKIYPSGQWWNEFALFTWYFVLYNSRTLVCESILKIVKKSLSTNSIAISIIFVQYTVVPLRMAVLSG